MKKLKFVGKMFSKRTSGYKISQERYEKMISEFPSCFDYEVYETFRSLRNTMACIGHTRPKIVEKVNILSQLIAKKFTDQHLTKDPPVVYDVIYL